MKAFLENLLAALEMGFHLLTGPLLRPWRTTWGSTPGERAAAWPGDDLVPAPRWTFTHAVTVEAPARAVWPWLVQVGQGRGGWYSYEGLENLAGCRIRNATGIRPDLQGLAVGDEVRIHPKAPGLPVRILLPGQALVLGGEIGDGQSASTWSFHVVPAGEGRCRLLARGRSTFGRGLASRLGFGPSIVEPVGFVMGRRMLRTIRSLAEAAWRGGGDGA